MPSHDTSQIPHRRMQVTLVVLLLFTLSLVAGGVIIQPREAAAQSILPTTVNSVNLVGKDHVLAGEKFTISAQIEPKDQIDALQFIWSPEPAAGQGTANAVYTWHELGKHAVKVTVLQAGVALGDGETTVEIIDAPALAADSTSVLLSATHVTVGQAVTASAEITPTAASQYTILWHPFPSEGQGKRQASFVWHDAGEKEVEVTILNSDGTVVRHRQIIYVAQESGEESGDDEAGPNKAFLPLLSIGETVQGAQTNAPEIIGGREATPGAWPWQVALLGNPNDGESQFCGGSLIAPDWVLTAAHCVDWWSPWTTLHVAIGRHRLSSNTGVVVPVSRIVVHPEYNDETSDSDLALLQLSVAQSSATISLDEAAYLPGDSVTAIGWGMTIPEDRFSGSDVLMEVTVPILENGACQNRLAALDNDVTDNMLCTDDLGVAAGTCHGDSGGPLMAARANEWIQIGIVSWGWPLCVANTPRVYTRVDRFHDWIESETGNHVANPDAFEPDDSRNAARSIATTETQTHNFHRAGDEDWVRFSAQGGSNYIIETSNLGTNADTYMYLYDSNGSLLAENDDGGNGYASRIELTANSAQEYYIKIRHYSSSVFGDGTQYDIRLSGGLGGQPDAYEPDNSSQSATSIAATSAAQTHNIHVAGDEDWLRFSASADTTYIIETFNLAAGADTYLYLYDGALNQLAANDDGGQGLASRIEFTAGSSQTYYVRIHHYSSAAFGPDTQYDVRVVTTNSPGGGDPYEPDNSSQSATSIATNGTAQTHNFHVAGDEDWLRFSASANTTYVIETFNLAANADTYLYLYDSALNQLVANDDGGQGLASRIEFTAGSSQTYYVRIRHYSSAAFGPDTQYDVSIATASGGGDRYEPDNSSQSATSIATNGTAQTHNFHVPGDEDWLRFSATANTTYVIETFNLAANADTYLYLYDSALNQLAANDDGGQGLASRIEITAGTSQTYYVRIRHYSSAAFGPNTQYDASVVAIGNDGDDPYEPDNSSQNATSIATDGSTQTHNIHIAGDEDWLRFSTSANTTYVIETFNLAAGADTYLYLYDNALNQLASNDDGGQGLASRIEFTASSSQTYYVRIRHYNSAAFGPDTQYDVSIVVMTPAEAIENAGFEQGTEGWTEYSFNEFPLIFHESSLPTSAYEGQWAAWLGGLDHEVSYVRQEVTVPANAAYLHYYHWIGSEDICGYDFGGVGVNGLWFYSYDLCSATGTSGWVEVSVDMSDFAGQTIYLDMVATTDGSGNSSLLVDNLSFQPSAAVVASSMFEPAGLPSRLWKDASIDESPMDKTPRDLSDNSGTSYMHTR